MRNPDQDQELEFELGSETEKRGQNDGFTVGVEKHTIKDQTLRIKIGEQESKDLPTTNPIKSFLSLFMWQQKPSMFNSGQRTTLPDTWLDQTLTMTVFSSE